jgi:hypothetical protein
MPRCRTETATGSSALDSLAYDAVKTGLLQNVIAPADEKQLWATDTGWRNRDIIAAPPEISCPLRR